MTLSTAECDAIALQCINPKLMTGEAGLYSTKWWDYRFYHPIKATVLFAQAYVWAVQQAIKRRYSLYKGMYAKVLNEDDLFANSKRIVTGLWKARREADKYGTPYDLWCHWAMDYAEERNWQYLPKPFQMYSEKALEGDISIVEYIVARWNDAKRERPCHSQSPFYRRECDHGHPYQKAHQKELIQRIMSSPCPAIDVSVYVFKEQLLNDRLVRAALGERASGVIEQALSFIDC